MIIKDFHVTYDLPEDVITDCEVIKSQEHDVAVSILYYYESSHTELLMELS